MNRIFKTTEDALMSKLKRMSLRREGNRLYSHLLNRETNHAPLDYTIYYLTLHDKDGSGWRNPLRLRRDRSDDECLAL